MSSNAGRPVARPATTAEPEQNRVSSPVFRENYPRLFIFLEKTPKNIGVPENGCNDGILGGWGIQGMLERQAQLSVGVRIGPTARRVLPYRRQGSMYGDAKMEL